MWSPRVTWIVLPWPLTRSRTTFESALQVLPPAVQNTVQLKFVAVNGMSVEPLFGSSNARSLDGPNPLCSNVSILKMIGIRPNTPLGFAAIAVAVALTGHDVNPRTPENVLRWGFETSTVTEVNVGPGFTATMTWTPSTPSV